MKARSNVTFIAFATAALISITSHNSRASLYQIDDGTAETTFGLGSASYDLIALNQFNVIAGQNMIGSIEVAFGSPSQPDPALNGLVYSVVVWNDPNNDGDPSDAVYVTSAKNVVTSANTDTFELTNLPICVPVTSSFFVGFIITTGANASGGPQYPAGVDLNTLSPGRSFMTAAPGGNGDIFNLNNNNLLALTNYESTGLSGNFTIRANPWAIPEPGTTSLLVITGLAAVGFAGRRRLVAGLQRFPLSRRSLRAFLFGRHRAHGHAPVVGGQIFVSSYARAVRQQVRPETRVLPSRRSFASRKPQIHLKHAA